MSLSISSINSGSNGNCYYIGNEHDAVLIDAGISCRETENRMARLGLSLDRVRGIFISHEHSDHIRGVSVISRKHGIPVYITPATLGNTRLSLSPELVRPFTADEPLSFGRLSVFPFHKHHDGNDPHSFTVTCDGITAGVFTDIGTPCENVIDRFSQCHAAFLEANYDETMLEKGNYPFYLKKRIRSDVGHLSNDQALDLFLHHRAPSLKLLLLSHLSAHNNTPQIVSGLFEPHANGTRVVVASRYKESEVFRIQ